jgi:hypothetical protein
VVAEQPNPQEDSHARIAALHAQVERCKRLIQEAEDRAAILQELANERAASGGMRKPD